ncbi:MAG: hypothetical protein DRI56_08880 [Chloroflexota bacterium]|nr:MAG: hypothetical protein DRI56_08880 [Chloroflexota bacterium]
MSISVYLEIAIGVVFVWLMLSMGVSALLEWLAGALKWRGKDLEKAIRDLLEKSDADDDASSLAKALYAHPLVKSLSKYGRRLPSYIPDRTFGLALLDVLVTAGTEESVLTVWSEKLAELESEEVKEKVIGDILSELARVAKANISENNKQVLIDLLIAEANKIEKKLIERYTGFESILSNFFDELFSDEMIGEFVDELLKKSEYDLLTDGAAKFVVNSPEIINTLDSLLVDAQGYIKQGEFQLAKYRASIETWFNDAMSRLGGAYKRRAQLFAFLIGIGLAIFLNIDSVAIVRTLWQEPTARSAVVAEAQSLGSLPEGEETLQDSIMLIDDKLEEFTLPAGWKKLDAEACAIVKSDPEEWQINCIVAADTYPQGMPKGANFWVEKIIGFVLSGAAAAQGAPFWFEILKKLVNMRSSGKNPDEEKK